MVEYWRLNHHRDVSSTVTDIRDVKSQGTPGEFTALDRRCVELKQRHGYCGQGSSFESLASFERTLGGVYHAQI